MLIVTTVYVEQVNSAAEPIAGTTPTITKLTSADEFIEKKLMEMPDANRELVIVYAGTNRVGGGNS
jgi:hypothetical protein